MSATVDIGEQTARPVLVVDDEQMICNRIRERLRAADCYVQVAHNARQAWTILDDFRPRVIVLDLSLPGEGGLAMMPRLLDQYPDVAIIIYSGHVSLDLVNQALQAGAFDVVEKDVKLNRLQDTVERALGRQHRDESLDQFRLELRRRMGVGPNQITSEPMQAVYDLADTFSTDPTLPVLIEGETGAGKDLLARYVHGAAGNVELPFIAVNCGAIPASLVESELFGYEKGAFTGASSQDRPGRFEMADGGTIFLDEVGEIPLESQVKLLRVLDNKTFYKVGGTREIRVNVRVMCATNRNLATEVREGRFRKDLFYRISAAHIKIPPLRERAEDIVVLARYFLDEFAESSGLDIYDISPAAEKALVGYDWPGNVRQLRNTIQRAVLNCRDSVIQVVDLLPLESGEVPGTRQAATTEEGWLRDLQRMPLPQDGLDLEAVEHALLRRAYEKHEGNLSATARYLGLSREAVRYRLNRHDGKAPEADRAGP
ncbi:MAG: sigma-54-dependent transcriptional regulator [Planctomycetota bacterium]